MRSFLSVKSPVILEKWDKTGCKVENTLYSDKLNYIYVSYMY